MTTLRRILFTALIAALAGLGVLTALIGRRPRTRIATRAEVLPPVSARVPASRGAGGGRGLAVGLVCLLFLMGSAGVVYESRDVLFGVSPRRPDGSAKPLAAPSSPGVGTARREAQVVGTMTGSAQTSPTGAPPAVSPERPPAVTAPGFYVVRVEPTGDAVAAGQAAPNATVEMLVDGRPVASAQANGEGRFTLIAPALPIGNSEISLRATDASGNVRRSAAAVSVVVAPSRHAKPLVAVISPDSPTLVLSQPDRPGTTQPRPDTTPGRQALHDDADGSARRGANLPAPDGAKAERPRGSNTGDASGIDAQAGASGQGTQEPNRAMAEGSVDSLKADNNARSSEGHGAVSTPPKVVAIDARDGGKLFVTARAPAGADLRLYLNDTLIAPATVGRDGTVTFAIGYGVRPGDYRVRLDLVDPATGKVRDRAEVPFSAPAAGHDAGVEYSAGPAVSGGPEPGNGVARREPPVDAANPPQPSSTGSLAANVSPGIATRSSEVYIPGVETARIERGDSLWRISRKTYGEGERYTLIYDANHDQIRDPDLIYPGQVFVLPNRETFGDERGGKSD